MKRFLIAFLFLIPSAFGLVETKKTWKGKSGPVEVHVEHAKEGITVTVRKSTQNTPDKVNIALIDSKGKQTVLELKAVNPQQGPELNPELRKFSGALDPSNQPFVGFELTIPFESEKAVIKSEDLESD